LFSALWNVALKFRNATWITNFATSRNKNTPISEVEGQQAQMREMHQILDFFNKMLG
jgi:hypothetical protein